MRKVRCLNQRRSKVEITGLARRKEWLSRSKLKPAFLIDSDAELFRSLIICIRLGSRKVHVRRLNRTLLSGNKALGKNTSFQIGDSPSAPFNDLWINFHKCVSVAF